MTLSKKLVYIYFTSLLSLSILISVSYYDNAYAKEYIDDMAECEKIYGVTMCFDNSTGDLADGKILFHNKDNYIASDKGREEIDVKNGKVDGLWKIYNKDGNIYKEQKYSAGKLTNFKLYYPNGRLQQDSAVKNDNMDGISRGYDEEGNMMIECQYKDDEKNGICKEYYKNGKISSATNYVNGQRHGTAKYYYEEGGLAYSLEYKNDERVY